MAVPVGTAGYCGYCRVLRILRVLHEVKVTVGYYCGSTRGKVLQGTAGTVGTVRAQRDSWVLHSTRGYCRVLWVLRVL
jgi:hypothetical protein